ASHPARGRRARGLAYRGGEGGCRTAGQARNGEIALTECDRPFEETQSASGNAAHNSRAEKSCQPQGQSLPESNQALIARILRPGVADRPRPAIVLPLGRMRQGTPLFLEAVRAALRAGSAKIEYLLPAFDGTAKKGPVQQHVRVRRVEGPQRRGTGH